MNLGWDFMSCDRHGALEFEIQIGKFEDESCS